MKRFTYSRQKGDVSLFIILMMVSIMSIIVTSVSTRSISEVNLSRQTFLGLQALQAANAGLEVWIAEYRDSGVAEVLCEADPIPAGCTNQISPEFFSDGSTTVTYVVTPILNGTAVERVVGVGTAEVGLPGDLQYSITRSFEVEF